MQSFYRKIGRPALGVLGTTALGIASPIIADKIVQLFVLLKQSLLQEMIGKGSFGRKALGVGLLAAGIGGTVKGTEYPYNKLKQPVEKAQYKKNMLNFSPWT